MDRLGRRSGIASVAILLVGLVWAYPYGRAAEAPGADGVRALLPELAKGHSDKIQMAWYATSFLRHVDAPVKDFAEKMSAEQKRLQKRLEAWAKANRADLKFHFGNDLAGKAREALEKDDGKAIESAGGADFQRLMLMFMYSDYDWQRHLIATLIPQAKDAELKGYLQDSLRVHEEQFKMIDGLLKKYKWE